MIKTRSNTPFRYATLGVVTACISVLAACGDVAERPDVETTMTFMGVVEQVTAPDSFDFDDLTFSRQLLEPEDEAMSVMVTADGRMYRVDEDPFEDLDLDALLEAYPDILGGAYPSNEEEMTELEGVVQPQIQLGSYDGRAELPLSLHDNYPYRAIGRIGRCTGALIGPRHVLTAAHCLHDGNKTGSGAVWYWPLSFAPGTDSTGNVNGAPRQGVARYAYYNYRNNRAYDIGLLVLQDRPETASLGQFGVYYYSPSAYAGKTVRNYGYPIASEPCPNGYIGAQQLFKDCHGFDMWGMTCSVANVSNDNIRHTCDTRKGHSGSPIYTTSNNILGVHWGTLSAPTYNEAARLRPQVLSRLATWMKIYPSQYRSLPSWTHRF